MPQPKASSSSSALPIWRPTKIMNMRDLSRDDDFLSHLLVEKLGTGAVPLIVHKMDGSRTIPKANPDELLAIVRDVSTPLHASPLSRASFAQDASEVDHLMFSSSSPRAGNSRARFARLSTDF